MVISANRSLRKTVDIEKLRPVNQLPLTCEWLGKAKLVRVQRMWFFERFATSAVVFSPCIPNETAAECFGNKWYFSSSDLESAVRIALRIALQLESLWKRDGDKDSTLMQFFGFDVNGAELIIGQPSVEVNHRFHLARSDQSWLSGSIDDLEEPIMLCQIHSKQRRGHPK